MRQAEVLMAVLTTEYLLYPKSTQTHSYQTLYTTAPYTRASYQNLHLPPAQTTPIYAHSGFINSVARFRDSAIFKRG